jgi:hypothetical protein
MMTKRDQSVPQIILPPTPEMGADELTEQQKVQAVSLWQEEQLKVLTRRATKQQLEMVPHLPPLASWNAVKHLPVPNYQPDWAVRAAILDHKGWKPWKKEDTVYWAYSYRLNPTNTLQVYLGGPRPPSPEQGEELVKTFHLSMVLTGRICLSIYLTRRRDAALVTSTGSALINLDEILAIRGMKKSQTRVYHGAQGATSYSNGYRWEDKQATIDDLIGLQQCYVQGACVININGHWEDLGVDDQYLHFSVLVRKNKQGVEEKIGIFFTPGNWLNLYEEKHTIYIAEVEREVFKLNPQQECHELQIGLFLTERWREAARKQEYEKPLSMQELLAASVISFDKKNPSRFIGRIEEALHGLYKRGILGTEPKCLTPVDRHKFRWTGDWLASQWVLLPPAAIREYYHHTIATPSSVIEAIPSSKRTRQRKKAP